MERIRTAEEARRERAFRQLVDTLSPDELDASLVESIRDSRLRPGAISVITLIEILGEVKRDKRSQVKELLEGVCTVHRLASWRTGNVFQG